MSRQVLLRAGLIILVFLAALGSASPSYAASAKEPRPASSPYDLIDAVNALRASFGLAPYSISPILMATAQGQADFLAATGSMTHSGSGGIGLTDRLLNAGYRLPETFPWVDSEPRILPAETKICRPKLPSIAGRATRRI